MQNALGTHPAFFWAVEDRLFCRLFRFLTEIFVVKGCKNGFDVL